MQPVPQTNPHDRTAGFSMTMGIPGTPDPHLAAKTLTVQAGPQKRLGLMAMAVDSPHVLKIGGKSHQVTCKDRRLYREAKGACFCLGAGCYTSKGPTAWHANEKELRELHEPNDRLAAAGEIHVYGFWSNDDCAAPVEGCKACGEATKAARKIEGASPDALKACAEHARVVGLLTPGDPNDAPP